MSLLLQLNIFTFWSSVPIANFELGNAAWLMLVAMIFDYSIIYFDILNLF